MLTISLEMALAILAMIIACASFRYSYITNKRSQEADALKNAIDNMEIPMMPNVDMTTFSRIDAPPPENKQNKIFTFIPRGEKFKNFGR